MEYFFLGDEELVTAFRSIGIQGMSVNDAEEAASIFIKITEGTDTGIILPEDAHSSKVIILTEEVSDWLEEYVVNWQLQGRYPLVVEIPGIQGRLEGRKSLVDSIREAIGIHI